MRPIDYSCDSGAFVSTPFDLVRFGMAINSGKLLQPATVQMLQASQRLASGEARIAEAFAADASASQKSRSQ